MSSRAPGASSKKPLSHDTLEPPANSNGVEPAESKRDKKRKDLVDRVKRLGEQQMEKRDVIFLDTHNILTDTHVHLLSTSPLQPYIPPPSSSHPSSSSSTPPASLPAPSYRPHSLAFYLLSLERDALLSAARHHYEYQLASARSLYEIERRRVEDEYQAARKHVRERLMDAVEEKRKKLKEEKEGDIGVDVLYDAQSHSRSTRTTRKKPLPGLTDPSEDPSSLALPGQRPDSPSLPSGAPGSSSLSILFDDLLSPSALALAGSGMGLGAAGLGGGNKRKKGVGAAPPGMTGPFLGLGRSIQAGLGGAREIEVDADLGEIRRKRRRK